MTAITEKSGGQPPETPQPDARGACRAAGEPAEPSSAAGEDPESGSPGLGSGPKAASGVLAISRKGMKALLQAYGHAVAMSRAAGRGVSFRVEVDSQGRTAVSAFAGPADQDGAEERPKTGGGGAPAVRGGRLSAAEILSGADMLNGAAFADLLGTTRATVNAQRQSGRMLGLAGAKRGFRFPVWQIDADGRPYAELRDLHDLLGGAWPVYRFLVQPHARLVGLTGREALEQGMGEAAVQAAENRQACQLRRTVLGF